MVAAAMHDIIILGAGPAGMTAGVYAARKQLDTLIISENIGGQTTWSSEVENYLGYTYITGPELVQKFEERTVASASKPRTCANSPPGP
jgi:alkyl hydroperoxide reductase subunit F